jgi:hypothetical protein
MAVSFITRFRRRIAVMPYIIVLLVPMALIGLYFMHRHNGVALSHESHSCVQSAAVASSADACPRAGTSGTE